MISIICFEESLIIPKEEAENLNLSYKTDPKIGYMNDKLQLMSSYGRYKEDCIEKDGKYYKDNDDMEKGKKVENYYLYIKYTGNVDYVHVEKDNHLVDKMKENTFNSKTNVHVGGGLITTYNDLLLKEDICTDALQSDLNNGWRIIAVCNQPDQRRPDYILGRYNPQLEVAEKPDAGR